MTKKDREWCFGQGDRGSDPRDHPEGLLERPLISGPAFQLSSGALERFFAGAVGESMRFQRGAPGVGGAARIESAQVVCLKWTNSGRRRILVQYSTRASSSISTTPP